MNGKERPIIFSGPMVRAILEGRKTQTRRVVKLEHVYDIDDAGTPLRMDDDGIYHPAPCPYGQPGDRLWVRESYWVSDCGKYFAHRGVSYNDMCAFCADGRVWKMAATTAYMPPRAISAFFALRYATHAESKKGAFELELCELDQSKQIIPLTGNAVISRETVKFRKKVPSIHMPRWASRITLEITGVRVERLQDINACDALAEGVPWDGEREHPRDNFITLWDSINGKRPGCSWNDNPWVWVVTFAMERT